MASTQNYEEQMYKAYNPHKWTSGEEATIVVYHEKCM